MKVNLSITCKQRKPGDLFQEITGHAVAGFTSVQDMERAVEKELGHKLEFQYFNSNVVPRRGGIFPHADVDMHKIDAKIDRYLQKT